MGLLSYGLMTERGAFTEWGLSSYPQLTPIVLILLEAELGP